MTSRTTGQIDAIAQLPADQARLYFDVIIMALPAAIRQLLEARCFTASGHAT